MKNIILIGFMGSGKTAMGRFLSDELEFEFYDADKEMEKSTGLKLNQIVKKYGEIRFRSEEKLVLIRLSKEENAVIATGGTFIERQDSIDILKENSIFVFLKTDEETIIQRLSRRNTNPFKEKGSIRQLVAKYYTAFLPRYEGIADIVVSTEGLTMEETAAKILKELKSSHWNI